MKLRKKRIHLNVKVVDDMMFEEYASNVNEIATSRFLKLCMIQAIIFRRL